MTDCVYRQLSFTSARRLVFYAAVAVCFACSSEGDDGSGNSSDSANNDPNAATGGQPDAGLDLGSGGTGSSSSNSTGGTSTTGVDGGLTFNGCTGQSLEAEPLPAVIEFLIDTSGSMNWAAPGSEKTKWADTAQALVEAIDQMPSTTAAGATFYPRTDGRRSCYRPDIGVPIGIMADADSEHRTALKDALLPIEPEGGTPTHPAYLYALDIIRETEYPGQRYLVLLTDGTPTYGINCSGDGRTPVDSEGLILQAQKAFEEGIRTFVIGSPGSEGAVEPLSRIASVGGTAREDCSDSGPRYCHFDMTQEPDFSQALREALGAILGFTLGCEWEVPAPPAGQELDPDKVNVKFVTGEGEEVEILKAADPESCTTGWKYSEDRAFVSLCPETCSQVQADPKGRLDLVFGCETKIQLR